MRCGRDGRIVYHTAHRTDAVGGVPYLYYYLGWIGNGTNRKWMDVIVIICFALHAHLPHFLPVPPDQGECSVFCADCFRRRNRVYASSRNAVAQRVHWEQQRKPFICLSFSLCLFRASVVNIIIGECACVCVRQCVWCLRFRLTCISRHRVYSVVCGIQ